MKYIEINWLKKWSRLALAQVKRLWEKYREQVVVPVLGDTPFSYSTSSHELLELDEFD
jgi:hypothetical protein